MTRFKFLLIGTSLSFLPTLSYAQCVATQDCATLGYTETSCNGGKGVKCPFGNKWACLGANEDEVRDKLCQELGFTLICTGTGYAGGAGSACGGKYTQCTCASGYEWKDGSCQKKVVLTGPDGDVYKCNGEVVAVKVSNMNFYVGIKNLGYTGWSKANDTCLNYSFCGRLKGTLPTLDQLKAMYYNKEALESLFVSNGGRKFSIDNSYWSSTYYSSNDGNDDYYIVNMLNGAANGSGIYSDRYVRPGLVDY